MANERYSREVGEAERFWEGRYSGREQVWSGKANPVLVDFARPLSAGRVLDLGCGEGGDAIWLAGQGWQVTAVDISATALERASARATESGVEGRIEFQHHDLASTFPLGAFDLVSAQYLQSPVEFTRASVLREAASAVAPGGLLLIVAHASVRPGPWADHNHDTSFPTPNEELAELNLDLTLWQTEFVGTRPNGRATTVADNVIALRRLIR